ncbi:MAG: hypothetical protein K8H86_09180, partial [Ignavibacteriaceae bacterium]|nr:hypothetical protein [Ignavibacteriaceae bacterium]
ILGFLLGGMFMNFYYRSPQSSSVMLDYQQIESKDEDIGKSEESIAEKKKELTKTKPVENEKKQVDTPPVYYSLNPTEADTTSLKQIYSEPTRNVRIRYPAGWTFVDQNVKGKLDAVSFWSTSKKYNTPPYVFLEVKEKYLFNAKRFTDTLETDFYNAFYNQPEELSGQVTQIFYFRTDDDQDFSLKLIVIGRENFLMFQKEFFGMIKTFKFGNKLFN